MRGDTISAEERLHITVANQPGEMFRAPGMDYDGTGYDDDSAISFSNTLHLPGNAIERNFHAAFAGDTRTHEREFTFCGKSAAVIAFARIPYRANASASGHDLIAG